MCHNPLKACRIGEAANPGPAGTRRTARVRKQKDKASGAVTSLPAGVLKALVNAVVQEMRNQFQVPLTPRPRPKLLKRRAGTARAEPSQVPAPQAPRNASVVLSEQGWEQGWVDEGSWWQPDSHGWYVDPETVGGSHLGSTATRVVLGGLRAGTRAGLLGGSVLNQWLGRLLRPGPRRFRKDQRRVLALEKKLKLQQTVHASYPRRGLRTECATRRQCVSPSRLECFLTVLLLGVRPTSNCDVATACNAARA